MSGTYPAVVMRARIGAVNTARRARVNIGSDVRIFVDVTNALTGLPVENITVPAALYWLPGTSADLSAGQPAEVSLFAPGVLTFVVPAEISNTYAFWIGIEGPIRTAYDGAFDVSSNGVPSGLTFAVSQWNEVLAAAAASGASAAGWTYRELAPRLAALEALTSYVVPTLSAFTAAPAVAEVGASVASVVLTVTRNRMDLPVAITGASTATIPAGQTSVTVPGPFTAAATWTAMVTDPSPPPEQLATATRPVTLSFQSRRYWGVSASATPDDAAILAMASEFATAASARKTVDLTLAAQRPVLAQPAAWPIAVTIRIAGFDYTNFTDTVRDLTNASGGVVSYRVRVLDNLLGTAEAPETLEVTF
jgi:hypothetical protein